MSHLTYAQAIIAGLIQGITELFPISSLGHNVLVPALIGGSWAKNLSLKAPAYLAFVVGLHVATAIGITAYFWRDWVRIIRGFFTSFQLSLTRPVKVRTSDQKLAWMIILATIPVGLAGLAFDHKFKTIFAVPSRAAIFLVLNGIILFAAERFRPRRSREADEMVQQEREAELAEVGARRPAGAGPGTPRVGGAHSSGQRALRHQEATSAIAADRRLTSMGYVQAIVVGAAQILALLAGISRDGVTMAAGMFRGMSREDAARFAFLLATPAIFAAGVLKLPNLLGPEGHGIRLQILAGSVVAGIAAYLSVRFLMKYFRTRTLMPFAIYCLVMGAGSYAYLTFVK